MDTLNVTPFNILFFHLNVNISLLYFIILFLAQRIELCIYWIPPDCLLYLLFFSTSLNNTFINFFLSFISVTDFIWDLFSFVLLVFSLHSSNDFVFLYSFPELCMFLFTILQFGHIENFCICVFWSSFIEVIVSIF